MTQNQRGNQIILRYDQKGTHTYYRATKGYLGVYLHTGVVACGAFSFNYISASSFQMSATFEFP